MTERQAGATYVQLATHYVSWATLFHIKCLLMPPKTSKTDRAAWTEEETMALVDYLHAHRAKTEGGGFTDTIFTGAVDHIAPLHKKGPIKNAKMITQRYTTIKEQWRIINTYRNRSGVSWDNDRGGFFGSSSEDVAQFKDYMASLQTKKRAALKAIDHKTWPYLEKMDDIMPTSTATGRFAHDGVDGDDGGNGGEKSDDESDPTFAAGQGPSNMLFPPSLVAPFAALSQSGLYAMSPSVSNPPTTPAFPSFPAPLSGSLSSSAHPTLSRPPPSLSSVTPWSPSSISLPLSFPPPLLSPVPPAASSLSVPRSSSLAASSSVAAPPSSSSISPLPSSTGPHITLAPSSSSAAPSIRSSVSSGKRKQSALGDADNEGSLKRRGPRSKAAATSAISSSDAALLTGFHGSMNHFSDVIHANNENQPQSLIRDAVSKLMGTWGQDDRFTHGEKVVLMKLFRKDVSMATMYAMSTESRLRRDWAMSELEAYGDEIAKFDQDDVL